MRHWAGINSFQTYIHFPTCSILAQWSNYFSFRRRTLHNNSYCKIHIKNWDEYPSLVSRLSFVHFCFVTKFCLIPLHLGHYDIIINTNHFLISSILAQRSNYPSLYSRPPDTSSYCLRKYKNLDKDCRLCPVYKFYSFDSWLSLFNSVASLGYWAGITALQIWICFTNCSILAQWSKRLSTYPRAPET